MQLYNANMVLYDTLMTVINSFIDSLMPTFAVWAGANYIAFSCVLKDNAGKKPSALLLITNALTVQTICNKTNDKYHLYWRLVCGLLSTPRNKDTTPTTLFLERHLTKIDKLSTTQYKQQRNLLDL
jgi:hypothetical protein